MKITRTTLLLIVIVGVASVLRLYDLPHGDAISDEVLYGFRAIGYLDFDFAVAQPTPLQLFEQDIPAWTKLSFHDHPPLVFLVQHWFMQLFGINLWGLRLSSALFGIGAVYLVYLLSRKLFSETAGLIPAPLLSVAILALYPSRVAVQESQVIFFILLTACCFIRSQEKSVWYLAAGASLGAALLSKYTAAVVIPPVLAYLVLYNRKAFRDWLFWGGAALALLVFSPVILYNMLLYRTFGHFDFQLFYIFKQTVPYWQETPGKEIGTLMDRIVGIPKNLLLYNSLIGTFLGTAGAAWLCVMTAVRRSREYAFVTLFFFSTLALFLAVGPAPRFLTLLIPWFAIMAGAMFAHSIASVPRLRTVTITTIVVLCIGELLISVNTIFATEPWGIESIQYSKIHYDMKAWGFSALDEYLGRETSGKYSELTIPYKYPFLETLKADAIEQARRRGYEPARTLFVFNENMSDLAALWVIHRRALYQAWPMIGAYNYRKTLSENGDNFYRDAGFESFIFIQDTDSILKNYAYRRTDDGDILESALRGRGIEPKPLYGPKGAEVFRIYRFE